MPQLNNEKRPWDMTTEELVSEVYIEYGLNTAGSTREQLINTLARLRAKEDPDADDELDPNEMTEDELRLELSDVYGVNTDGYSHEQLINTLRERLANQVPAFNTGVFALRNIIREPEMMTSQELRDELIHNFTQTVNGYNDELLIDAVTRLRSNQVPAPAQQIQLPLRHPSTMTTRELREEINRIYNIFNIDGLTQRQLSLVLIELRAGRQPEIPAQQPEIPAQQPAQRYYHNTAEMTTAEMRWELINVYQFNPDPNYNRSQIEDILNEYRGERQYIEVDGGRKRRSKLRRLNKRRSNRNYI